MKFYFKFGVAFCVIALAISASAGSLTTLNYEAIVSAPNATVSHSFNRESLSFVGNSIFGGPSGTVSKPQSSLVLNAALGGSSHSNLMPNHLLPGSDSPAGMIGKMRNPNTQVPEGGSQLSYLLASGLALFAGIFIAGKQRRRLALN